MAKQPSDNIAMVPMDSLGFLVSSDYKHLHSEFLSPLQPLKEPPDFRDILNGRKANLAKWTDHEHENTIQLLPE